MHGIKKTLNLHHKKSFSTRLATVEKPKYPKIIDASREGKIRHKRQLFYDRVQSLPTVEEKLYAITENRGFFERNYLFSSCPNNYSGALFSKYVTRTHTLHGLPQHLQSSNVDEDYERLKPQLCLALNKHFSNVWRETKLKSMSEFLKDHECGSKFVNEIFTLLCRSLGHKYNHLISASFDPRPRIDSYWFHGNFVSKTENMAKNKIKEKQLVLMRNIGFQFLDTPYFTIRMNKPLPLVVPRNDPLCTTSEVIDYNYHPKVFGIPYKTRYITSVPGYWPGDENIFPHIQVYTMDKMDTLTDKIEHCDIKHIEEAFGVMSSFGWLNGLSTYHGFTPYNDLTYPFVGNTVLTNGQDWLFYVYQLNTVSFHEDVDNKDCRNLCWLSGRMRLFDTIENGEVKGLNDDVFKTIVKFFVQEPVAVDERVLTPYLGKDTRTKEEIETMRIQLREWYHNVPRPWATRHEIPFWHHVYKRHPEAPPCPSVRLY